MKKASRLWHHKGRITQENQSPRHQPAHFARPRLVVRCFLKSRDVEFNLVPHLAENGGLFSDAMSRVQHPYLEPLFIPYEKENKKKNLSRHACSQSPGSARHSC